MKNLLKLEELAQFGLCLILLLYAHVPWWCYLLLLIGPDIGMLGYLVNTRVGAIAYNLLHHKGIATLLVMLGIPSMMEVVILWSKGMGDLHATPPLLLGIILFGHASMDRIFGYGLKYADSFQHTHLGWIGKVAGGDRAGRA